MKAIACIPARMSSTRFPGKPMAEIHGIPMIGHCYFRTKMCNSLEATYVATCDREIYEYINSIGGDAVMTSDGHQRATDRVAESLISIEGETGENYDVAVMVQGDEPMVTPTMITESLNPFNEDSTVKVVNLMSGIKRIEEFENPNEVKVVVDNNSNALYFSREPIPSRKKWSGEISMLKQVCIIPFRREFLLQFNEMEETTLERIESVDMMRILEHGGSVRMVMTQSETYSVDTPEDLKKVEMLMNSDLLMREYCNKIT